MAEKRHEFFQSTFSVDFFIRICRRKSLDFIMQSFESELIFLEIELTGVFEYQPNKTNNRFFLEVRK